MGVFNFFGPSKEEIWSQIANDIGGEFIDAGFWGKDILKYKHKDWEILLDTYKQSTGKTQTTYTRLRVPFINKNGLRFNIFRKGFFSSIGKFFGMQDIEIGDFNFDEKFIIKGNFESKIKHLLNDQNLKRLFDKQKRLNIQIMDDEGWFAQKYPKGVDILYFSTIGIIKDKNSLLNLFELFAAILDRLVEINSAHNDDPNITIK